MASVAILGSPQEVERPDGTSYDLPDPFLSSILDFVRRALDQIARALHIVVVRTRNHCAGIGNQNEFFRGQDGEFVNPSQDPSGHDVYYLLKNLAYFADTVYASALGVDSELLTRNVDYLLETIRNHIAHQSYLGCERNDAFGTNPHCSLRKYGTVKECLHKCIEMLGWFRKAPFYNDVHGKIRCIQKNLINMKAVVEDHERHKKAMERAEDQALDTRRATAFLHKLLRQLEKEGRRDGDPEQRPITHAVNMILAPRIP